MLVGLLAPLYPPAYRGGGPIRSIAALVANRAPEDQVALITSDRDLNQTDRLDVPRNVWVTAAGLSSRFTSVDKPRELMRAFVELRRACPDLIHLNSVMNPQFSILPMLLHRVGYWRNASILLAPRGEFGDAALARRAWKKRLYLAVFRLLGLQHRVTWHSTSPHETADIKALWGEGITVVERSNDSLIEPRDAPTSAHDGPLKMVFLGRIVEHKGLHIVQEALAEVVAPVEMHVFGTREDAAYFARCEGLAATLPSHVSVTFHGAVPADEVVDTLAQFDLLVMPTAGENFGHVIAESLAAACPVMVTPFTPWGQWLRAGGGIVVADRQPQNWANALNQFASLTPAERATRRVAAGQAFVAWTNREQSPHVWTLAAAVARK